MDSNFPIFTFHPDGEILSEELWQLPKPIPKQLHVRGSLDAIELLEELPARGLAVVGTRDPRERSLMETRRIIRMLKDQRIIIVSGLARGIDAAAHETALEVGLPTIAVLGSAVDEIYPASNRPLADRILRQGGLLISEYLPGTRAFAGNFIERNRLIAGLSRATWVVEAGYRSGALNTAKWARDHHRPTYATPCYPGDPALAGNQRLLDDGHAQAVWGPHSFGSEWLGLASCGFDTPPGTTPDFLDAHRLARSLSRAESVSGLDIHELLERQVRDGWPADRFFLALQYALESGLVVERNGLLLKNPDRSL